MTALLHRLDDAPGIVIHISVVYDLILRNGYLCDGLTIEQSDIGIRDGQIAEIGDLHLASAGETVDLRGLTVLPGVIDTQVHFREPGLEHKETIRTGTQSAAAGGVTTVLEMPNTNPPTTSKSALEDKVARARKDAWCNIGFFCGATPGNIADLAALENSPGCPGIKIFMGSSTGSLLVADDPTLLGVLLSCHKRSPVHAEDNSRLEELKSSFPGPWEVSRHPFLRDPESARVATERLIRLSERANHPVHILHVSTADEIPLIRAAKSRSSLVTAEVTPQHLYFHGPDCYEKLGSLVQMNPPIRDRTHQAALRSACSKGLFDVIGSDHAPHTLEEKQRPYPHSPSGIPGVQTLLPVMLTLALEQHLIPLTDLVRLTSLNPANLYGIGHKGRLAIGFGADLAIVDLNNRWKVDRKWLRNKCGWSPFEGEELVGRPVHTLVNGHFALRDGVLSDQPYGMVAAFDP